MASGNAKFISTCTTFCSCQPCSNSSTNRVILNLNRGWSPTILFSLYSILLVVLHEISIFLSFILLVVHLNFDEEQLIPVH